MSRILGNKQGLDSAAHRLQTASSVPSFAALWTVQSLAMLQLGKPGGHTAWGHLHLGAAEIKNLNDLNDDWYYVSNILAKS